MSDVERGEVARLRRYVQQELAAAALYRAVASQTEGRAQRALLRLAEGEEHHAREWAGVLARLGTDVDVAPRPPGLRARALARLARWVGLPGVMPLLERHEGAEIERYVGDPHTPAGLVDEERDHARVLSSLAPSWRTRVAGTLRAGVFGVSDGLVSNLALVMGVVGSGASRSAVVIAGAAGLIAGALSMAVGEYVSVASQRELLGGGVVADESADAVGSPWSAGAASLLAFASGAALPLAPFLLGSGAAAAVTAVVLGGVALFALGAAVSLLTLRPLWRSGGRQLGLGLAAALATYLVGRVLGVAVG